MTLRDTWPSVFAQRAAIYDWFSGLFARELTDEQFIAYQNGTADEWLDTFVDIGLGDTTARLKKSIADWQKKSIEAIDLRADFAELFLLDKHTAAIPYASFYLEEGGTLYGHMEAKMRHFLTENHLQLQADFNEPADHLAVYLALLKTWSSNPIYDDNVETIATEQQQFLTEALCSWLPKFEKKCQQISVDSDFYPTLATLLANFVEVDSDYLQQLQSTLPK